jgi:hypothetical protein
LIGRFDLFEKALVQAVQEIDIQKLGIGLETVNDDNNNQPFTNQELQERFDLIKQNDIQEVDIWDMPIPQSFWPYLHDFINN